MNKNISFAIGRFAALSIAIETIVFAFSLIWGLIFHTQFDKNLGYIAGLLIAVSVVILMACFYNSIREQLKILGSLALVSSVIYAPLSIGNYFLQLSTVLFSWSDCGSDIGCAIH